MKVISKKILVLALAAAPCAKALWVAYDPAQPLASIKQQIEGRPASSAMQVAQSTITESQATPIRGTEVDTHNVSWYQSYDASGKPQFGELDAAIQETLATIPETRAFPKEQTVDPEVAADLARREAAIGESRGKDKLINLINALFYAKDNGLQEAIDRLENRLDSDFWDLDTTEKNVIKTGNYEQAVNVYQRYTPSIQFDTAELEELANREAAIGESRGKDKLINLINALFYAKDHGIADAVARLSQRLDDDFQNIDSSLRDLIKTGDYGQAVDVYQGYQG